MAGEPRSEKAGPYAPQEDARDGGLRPVRSRRSPPTGAVSKGRSKTLARFESCRPHGPCSHTRAKGRAAKWRPTDARRRGGAGGGGRRQGRNRGTKASAHAEAGIRVRVWVRMAGRNGHAECPCQPALCAGHQPTRRLRRSHGPPRCRRGHSARGRGASRCPYRRDWSLRTAGTRRRPGSSARC
jgi:hypothetical protein